MIRWIRPLITSEQMLTPAPMSIVYVFSLIFIIQNFASGKPNPSLEICTRGSEICRDDGRSFPAQTEAPSSTVTVMSPPRIWDEPMIFRRRRSDGGAEKPICSPNRALDDEGKIEENNMDHEDLTLPSNKLSKYPFDEVYAQVKLPPEVKNELKSMALGFSEKYGIHDDPVNAQDSGGDCTERNISVGLDDPNFSNLSARERKNLRISSNRFKNVAKILVYGFMRSTFYILDTILTATFFLFMISIVYGWLFSQKL